MAEGPAISPRASDPLVACIGQLAERFGVAWAPSMFTSLPRDVDGRLPLHQAEAGFEVLGLSCMARRAPKLSRRSEDYPAIVATRGEGPVVVHEWRDGDALVWRPSLDEARWEPAAALLADYAGWIATAFGDPTAIRDPGGSWRIKARSHWFWSEIEKLGPQFRPVWLASLLINVLALALPLFTMNVYDRVIPNRALLQKS